MPLEPTSLHTHTACHYGFAVVVFAWRDYQENDLSPRCPEIALDVILNYNFGAKI